MAAGAGRRVTLGETGFAWVPQVHIAQLGEQCPGLMSSAHFS